MRKKRICAAAACLVMLTGCAGGTSSVQTTAPQTSAPETTAPETTAPAAEEVTVPELEGYSLLWHDEFSGEALDETLWNYEPHEPGWTNEELQEYTTSTDNVFVRDGNLVIKAIKGEKDGKTHYTSGKVTGQGKTQFTYGKVVARAKVPEGKGLWPAVWMMPQVEKFYGQWPKCGEIDIMEVLGSETKKAYGTLHYGEPHADQQGTVELTDGTFASDFHEYSVEWEPSEIRWYIDGNLYLTANDWFSAPAGGDERMYPAPFNQPFFVQMNLAVGGTWPGNPDETTDFDKAEFLIDYVRVYRKPAYDTNVTKPEKKYREALEDGNFIYNGDFSEKEDLTDDVNWKFLLFEGGDGAAEIRDNMIVITTKSEGNVDYSVQLVQPEMPMVKGKKYRASFDAWADEPRDIIVCVSAPNAGWIRYLQDTTLKITDKKATYSYDFEMNDKNDPNGRLEFNLGHKGSTATVYITNVRVEEIE
ncbi:MAG: family 16 glycosylhydrolase [Oscillospiraceae bacterium]|nr:family 16 glycosylhydrolase [Oscillospiraceae bacterium]